MVSPRDKEGLAIILSRYYNKNIKDIYDLIDEDNLPSDICDLELINNKRSKRNSNLTDEFVAQMEYLHNIYQTHLFNPPSVKDAYIKQEEIPDKNKYKLRDSRNYTIGSYIEDQQINNLKSRIENQIDVLESELESCDISESAFNLYHLIFTVCRYTVDNNNFTSFSNIFRTLRKFGKSIELSDNGIEIAYEKTGDRMSKIFDNSENIPETLWNYYALNMTSLVNSADKCKKYSDKYDYKFTAE